MEPEAKQTDYAPVALVLGLALVGLLAVTAVLGWALLAQDPEVRTVVKTVQAKPKPGSVLIGLPRRADFDSVQANPAVPFAIVCTAYSNRPTQATTGPDTYTKKMIGFRVVTDCVTVPADPKAPKS